MNMLSLYSGVGGIDLAAHWAGIETIAFCEADPFCRSILSRHWPGVPIFDSDEHVTAESIRESIDIIAGGPPCQPFSVAGKREGVADPRHRWPEMARIVGELRPTWVVVENVAGFGDVAQRLVRPDLDVLGYETVRFDVPAAAVGAPHERMRIFVVAYDHRRRELQPQGSLGEQRRRAGDGGHELAHANGLPASGQECELGRATQAVTGTASGMAHPDDTGRRERRGTEPVRQEQPAAERGGGGAVEHAEGGRGRRDPQQRVCADGEAQLRRSSHQRPSSGDTTRAPESRLGGIAAGISDRLDAARWPAPRGAAQHDWEPPRVTTEREFRRKRLKALGNAVVPLQIYPIFVAIGNAVTVHLTFD